MAANYNNIRNLSQNVTMDSIGSKLELFGLGAIMIVLIISVAMVLARLFTKDDFSANYFALRAFSSSVICARVFLSML